MHSSVCICVKNLHQNQIYTKPDRKSHEPRIDIKRVKEIRIGNLPARSRRGADKSGHDRRDGDD